MCKANHFCLFISLYRPLLLHSKSYKQQFLWYIFLVIQTLYDFSKAKLLCTKCSELTKNSEMYLGIYRYRVIFGYEKESFLLLELKTQYCTCEQPLKYDRAEYMRSTSAANGFSRTGAVQSISGP